MKRMARPPISVRRRLPGERPRPPSLPDTQRFVDGGMKAVLEQW